jgi:hypothetical protein
MIMAETGSTWKVAGSKREIVPTGPIPGRTPMRVPINTPMKQYRRLARLKLAAKPLRIPEKMSI